MGTIMTTHIPASGTGTWKLPSVQDLLGSVRSKHAPLPRSQSIFRLPSPSIASRDVEPGKYSRTDPNSHVRSSGWHSSLPSPEQPNRGSESDPRHAMLGRTEFVYPQDGYKCVKNENRLDSSPKAIQSAKIPISPFRVITPFRPGRRSQPRAYATMGHNGNIAVSSSGRSAGKIASNDRHKLSEKHRRDGMGAFVQAADILRQDLNPGLLSGCSICAEDIENDEEPSAFSIQLENAPPTGGHPVKKTKNDMLAEGLMWEFSIVLHMWPSQVCKKIEKTRIFAAQMAREREIGLRNDCGKSNKWQADVRAEVLEQVLNAMGRACDRHGVDVWAVDPCSYIATPQSSSTKASPAIGQKRSRETSEETDHDRRVKQREGSENC